MLQIEHVYCALAALLAAVAWRSLRAGRVEAAVFWGVLAACLASGRAVIDAAAAGTHWPGQLVGCGVVVLAVLAPRLGAPRATERPVAEREADAARLGHRLLVPALLVPLLTVVSALGGEHLAVAGFPVFGGPSLTLTGLAVASVVSLVVALRVTRAPPKLAVVEGQRLLDTIGWAALLPMLLATLGTVLSRAGVGDAVASLTALVISPESRVACVLAFGLGMVALTIVMGNAFAAFPVMMAGIGLPLLVERHHADPAILGALGMLTGYCGTLLTPMAANFNVVPAALLELDDPHAVIRAQVPTAVALLVVNLALIGWLALP